MAEMVKKATRESFGEALTALAETNPDIVVLDGGHNLVALEMITQRIKSHVEEA